MKPKRHKRKPMKPIRRGPNPKRPDLVTSEDFRQLSISHIGTEKQCTATSKQSGMRCKKPCVPGGTVCRLHGGEQQRQAIARRKTNEKIREVVAGLGRKVIVDPAQALLEQVWECAGNVAWYQQQIDMLEDAPHVERDGEGWLVVHAGVYGPDHLGDQTPHVLVKLYNDERDRLARIAKFAIDAGIAERQVRIAEQQGQMFAAIVLVVLSRAELGLSGEQIETARKLFGEELRKKALTDGEPPSTKQRAAVTVDE